MARMISTAFRPSRPSTAGGVPVSMACTKSASCRFSATGSWAYNVAHGEQTTLTELFDLIRVILGSRMPHMRNVRAVHRAPRRGDLPRSLASIDKAVKLLGYAPTFRLKDGLEQTIDWYAANLVPVSKEAANA